MIFTSLTRETVWLLNNRESDLLVTLKSLLGVEKCLENGHFLSITRNFPVYLELESKCLVALSLLLVITGTYSLFLPHYCGYIEGKYEYSPVRRVLYRRVMRRLRVFVEESYIANSAEWVLGEYLGEHPLVAREPDEILQKLARYGVEEYERRRTSAGLSRAIDKFHGFFHRIYTPDPTLTHSHLQYRYIPLTSHPSLSLLIAIPGWLSADKDMKRKWNGLLNYAVASRITALVWDADTMKSISGTVVSFRRACGKAKFAGKQLARHISSHSFGLGPVSLIGFSLGARVIYHTLKELHELSSGEIFIQDVILLGGAVKNDPVMWSELLTEIAGRAVNVYSRCDLVLKRMYGLAMLGKRKPVGRGAVMCGKMENYDASSYISGHKEHTRQLTRTLQVIQYQP